MKRISLLVFLVMKGLNLFSQTDQSGQVTLNDEEEKHKCITVGFFQGGGCRIGADFEVLVTDKIGIQAGAGYLGYGAGVNYHLKPSVRSSFISLQYWHRGFGKSFVQDLIGPNFVRREDKWFSIQLGIGYSLRKGPALPEPELQLPVMFLYSVGFYLPV